MLQMQVRERTRFRGRCRSLPCAPSQSTATNLSQEKTMNTMTRSNQGGWTVLAGAVTALMLSVSTAAIAAPAGKGDIRKITISYAELDLSKPAGARVLYQRIERAALEVCNNFAEPFSEMRAKKSSCFEDAVANAVTDVNREQLYAIHRDHVTRIASN